MSLYGLAVLLKCIKIFTLKSWMLLTPFIQPCWPISSEIESFDDILDAIGAAEDELKVEDLTGEPDELAAALEDDDLWAKLVETESFDDIPDFVGAAEEGPVIEDLSKEVDEIAASLELESFFEELEEVAAELMIDGLTGELDELAAALEEDEIFAELEMPADRKDELLLVAEPLVPVAEPCSVFDEDGCKELMVEAVVPELLEVNPPGPSEDWLLEIPLEIDLVEVTSEDLTEDVETEAVEGVSLLEELKLVIVVDEGFTPHLAL